jgi:hypothetical protein
MIRRNMDHAGDLRSHRLRGEMMPLMQRRGSATEERAAGEATRTKARTGGTVGQISHYAIRRRLAVLRHQSRRPPPDADHSRMSRTCKSRRTHAIAIAAWAQITSAQIAASSTAF